jgi:succinate dehydrogenase/fumarate reductase flavoprotein subunit
MYGRTAAAADKSCDGIAMAFRAGASLVNMEMVHFHPLGIVAGDSSMSGTVLDEGILGGRPAQGEVSLDISPIGIDLLRARFPETLRRCEDAGLDLQRLVTSPTAYAMLGGIEVDTQMRTSVEGLFVAGGDVGAIHGSGLLAGNRLTASGVFGTLAGELVPDLLADRSATPFSQVKETMVAALAPLERTEGSSAFQLKQRLQTLMWSKAGRIRNGAGLAEAAAELETMTKELESVSIRPFLQFNMEWQEYLDLRSLLPVSRLVVSSALAREESRGAHYRADFPVLRAGQPSSTVVHRHFTGVRLRPVELSRLHPPAD